MYQVRTNTWVPLAEFDTVREALEYIAKTGPHVVGIEVWDVIRPNHPKLVCAVDTEGLDEHYASEVVRYTRNGSLGLDDPWRVPDRYLSRR
jgi:hypothetical protein